jgi:hypothetical protein
MSREIFFEKLSGEITMYISTSQLRQKKVHYTLPNFVFKELSGLIQTNSSLYPTG